METLLEIKNLSKSFDDKPVHCGVTFNLYKGETIGLLGNSGTGKSVLLRSLIGLEEIDSGEIYYRKQKVNGLKEEELFKIRTKVSYSFQNGALFDSVSVYENIAYPLFEHTKMKEAEVDAKVMEILTLVNMANPKILCPPISQVECKNGLDWPGQWRLILRFFSMMSPPQVLIQLTLNWF